MKKDRDTSDATALRRRAEEKHKAENISHPAITELDIQRLVHELEVHQIELELQNEELRQAKNDAEAWQEWYTDLYEFAPVGYFTLNRQADILQTNLTGSSLLGVERSRLIHRRFALFISPEYRPAFSTFMESVFGSQAKQTFEMVLEIESSAPIYVRIDGVYKDCKECRVTMLDITEHKKSEEEAQRLSAVVQQEKDRLSTLIDSISDEIWFADAEKRLVLMNRAVFDEFDVGPGEIAEVEKISAHYEVYRPDGTPRPVDEAPPLRALKGEVVKDQEEIVKTPATGELRYRSVNASPVMDAGGDIIGSVSVVRDITDRKEAEEALVAAHRQTQSVIDNAAAIVYAFDLEERFLLANKALAELLNSTPEQMIGRRRHEFMPKDDADWHEANDRQVIETGKELEFEEHSQLKGRAITWLTSKFPLRDGLGKIYAVGGISSDISERKRVEEAFQASMQDFRALAESVPEIIAWATRPDGHNTFTSQQWVDYTGLTLEESYGDGWIIPFHPDDRLRAWETWQNAVNKDTAYSLECRLKRADDTYRWWLIRGTPLRDESGKIIKWFGTCMDIHDMKEIEDALRESEERFRTMANAIPQLAWMANPDGYIFWYNQRWYEYTGTTPEQMEGWGWQSAHDPEALPSVVERWKASITTGEPLDMEFPLLGADGKFRPFLTRVMPMKDSEGRVLRWFGTNTDVSEARELEVNKRDFYRRTILAATSGKLEIVEPEQIRALHGNLVQSWRFSKPDEYSSALGQSFELAENLGFAGDRLHRFMSCAGEMLGNAQKHARGGVASFYRKDSSILFVVSDTGPGIDSLNVPEIAFVNGYSTAGTGGLGYKFIIGSADKTYLATGPGGTTVAVEISFHELDASP